MRSSSTGDVAMPTALQRINRIIAGVYGRQQVVNSRRHGMVTMRGMHFLQHQPRPAADGPVAE